MASALSWNPDYAVWVQALVRAIPGGGGGGILGGGVPPGSSNPDPISDLNMPFSLTRICFGMIGLNSDLSSCLLTNRIVLDDIPVKQ